jgi:hypothetical protein
MVIFQPNRRPIHPVDMHAAAFASRQQERAPVQGALD